MTLFDPIEITLRLSHPRDIVTLTEIVGMALDDAADCFSDDGDTSSAFQYAEVNELYEALWACLTKQGYELKKMPGDEYEKLYYKGERITYERTKRIEGVPKEQVKKWLRVHE